MWGDWSHLSSFIQPPPPPEAAGGPRLCRELVTASRDPGGRLRATSKLQEGGGGPAGPGSPCIDGPSDDSVTRAGGGVHSMARGQTKVSTCPEEPEVSPEWVHNQTPKWQGSHQAGQRAGALRRSKVLAGKLGWGPPQSRTPARGGGGHTWAVSTGPGPPGPVSQARRALSREASTLAGWHPLARHRKPSSSLICDSVSPPRGGHCRFAGSLGPQGQRGPGSREAAVCSWASPVPPPGLTPSRPRTGR